MRDSEGSLVEHTLWGKPLSYWKDAEAERDRLREALLTVRKALDIASDGMPYSMVLNLKGIVTNALNQAQP